MSATDSLALLAERTASLPAALQVAVTAPLPDLAALRSKKSIVVTGGGLSEGPARVLVTLLCRAGVAARFVGQGAFLRRQPPRLDAGLILFSQGLAPNARLPLVSLGVLDGPAAGVTFGAGLLVTSVAPAPRGLGQLLLALVERGHVVWTLPPAEEGQLLLRVVGPAVALVAALRLAEALAPGIVSAATLAAIPGVVDARLRAPSVDLLANGPTLALLADEHWHDLLLPLRWKLLEGLRVGEPPLWDFLQAAHGPLQSFYDGPATLLAVGPATDPVRAALLRRWQSVLRPAAHRLIELSATLPEPAALVELDAALDAALLTTLVAHPRPLDDWPSRGHDGPIYDIDPASWTLDS